MGVEKALGAWVEAVAAVMVLAMVTRVWARDLG